jgi:hypothetical protein
MDGQIILRPDVLFNARNTPDFNAPTEGWHGTDFIEIADIDYALFRLMAFAGESGMSLPHLAAALEKYLKAILLGRGLPAPRGKTGHDLVRLLKSVSSQCPEFTHHSFEVFCWCLDPYRQLGKYPERILPEGGLALHAYWNVLDFRGIREADFAIAHLRSAAIQSNGANPGAAWFLEALVHREVRLARTAGPQEAALQALREAVVSHNDYFSVTNLPTFHQRFNERRVFPISELATLQPDTMS